jgi:hypothetical protein
MVKIDVLLECVVKKLVAKLVSCTFEIAKLATIAENALKGVKCNFSSIFFFFFFLVWSYCDKKVKSRLILISEAMLPF